MCAALTTLEEVRSQLSLDDDVVDHDPLLQMLLERATDAIQRHTGCEFVSVAHDDQLDEDGNPAPTPVGRRVLYHGGTLQLAPWEAREVTSIVIDPDADEPTTLATTGYRTIPFASVDGVVRAIDMLGAYGTTLPAPRVVEITALWGWPSVPPAVKQACEATVIHWYRVHAQHQRSGGDDVDRYGPVAFPTMARWLLEPFRLRRGL